jgi:predicted nucleic acid-binding protein
MLIYIDNCVLNRPFDDQSQERIYFETQAFLILLKQIDTGKINFLNSFAIEYEISAISDTERESKIREYLKAASTYVDYNKKIEYRAKELMTFGFSAMDSVHIAVAEFAKVDYFVTCDDAILKLSEKHSKRIKVKVTSVSKLVTEIINYAQNN